MRRIEQNKTERRPPPSARILITTVLVTILGFSAVCAMILLNMRHSEEDRARQALNNLAAVIDGEIARTFDQYDAALRAVAADLLVPEIANASKPVRQRILFEHATTAQNFGPMQVFDPAGNLTDDSSTLEPRPENRAAERYFTEQRDDPYAGLYISPPMMLRGARAIVLSRRISAVDGTCLGVVVGSIRLSYFSVILDKLHLAVGEAVSVLRRDGLVIARAPLDRDSIGKDLSKERIIKRLLSESSGWDSGSDPIDNVSRMYVWRDDIRPLAVIVGKSWDDIYVVWTKQVIQIGAIMAALIAFVFAVTIFLAREIRRRDRAEDKLEELATTDALTGVKNRRKFDIEIDLEWRRAIRQSTPLALLMIDADHFKSFNDNFGHQAGDQALIAIALCIGSSARRAGECATRYGGEEFAVLLPGLASEDAFEVAEMIRRKIEELPPDPVRLTVSIGVASMTPTTAMSWSLIVEAADKALYASKDDGRNRSTIASCPPAITLVA